MTRCAGKVKYAKAGEARAQMRRMIAAGRVIGSCDVYPCTKCGGWHWGHSGGTRFAKAAQTINAIDRAIARDATKGGGHA